MMDNRFVKLARNIVNYALEINEGSSVLIDNFDGADILVNLQLSQIHI